MPLRLVQTVAPTEEPLSLAEVKLHLRITHDDEDQLLFLYMQAAREQLERMTRRQLLSATYTLTMAAFPSCRLFSVPRPPLQSVTSVKYLDANGVERTLSGTTVYYVDTTAEPGCILLRYGQSWPTTYSQANAITVTYVAGWSSYAKVPHGLKMALLLLVGHFYENREATIEKALTLIPNGLQTLMWLHRAIVFDEAEEVYHG